MSNPVFKITPSGINYWASTLSLSGTIQGATSVVPTFFHYLSNNTKEILPIQAAGTYSFEVIRDSRWNNDGSYLTVIGSITYLDGTKKDLVGRLNTYMGGVIFSDGSFDYSANDFVTNSFDSFFKIGQFAPGNNADIGKKFTFSISPVSPTYLISASSPSVNEGSTVTFQITTNSVEWGSAINYSISGISQSDLSSGSLLGSATVVQNGNSGTATVTLGIAADQLTEGAENLTINVSGITSLVVVNDTSRANSTYSLASDKTTVDEGLSVTFTLSTSNIASGTTVPYTLSGISTADVTGGSLSGNAVVNSSGIATITIGIVNDLLTEGSETLTITAGGVTSSVVINDTSTLPIANIPPAPSPPIQVPPTQQPSIINWTPKTLGEKINGTGTVDTLSINSNKSNFLINSNLTVTEKQTGYSANLNSIERIKFSDTFVALDLSGNAGKAVSMLGAVLGRDSLANKSVVGIALKIYDSNTMSDFSIARLALDSVLGPNASDKLVVDLLYKNLAGVLPDPLSEGLYVSMIKNGTYTQESLALMAVSLDLNKTNIKLAGLSQTGIEYTPSLF